MGLKNTTPYVSKPVLLAGKTLKLNFFKNNLILVAIKYSCKSVLWRVDIFGCLRDMNNRLDDIIEVVYICLYQSLKVVVYFFNKKGGGIGKVVREIYIITIAN